MTKAQIQRNIWRHKKRYDKYRKRVKRAELNPKRQPRPEDMEHRDLNLDRYKYFLTLLRYKQGRIAERRPDQ